MGVDKVGVDEMGVDKMGSRQSGITPLTPGWVQEFRGCRPTSSTSHFVYFPFRLLPLRLLIFRLLIFFV